MTLTGRSDKENHQIEWKESWRDEYLRWICGFANAEGGVLVIGRNDKGVAAHARAAQEQGETAQEISPTTPMTTPIAASTTPITASTTPMTTPIAPRHQMLALILENPDISQQELADAVGLSRDGIRYHLNKMKRAGEIRRVGPSRGGRWEVTQEVESPHPGSSPAGNP